MKLLTVLALCSTLHLSASVYSQSKSLSLTYKNVKVKDVFKAIEEQSDYRFFYNDDLSAVSRVVNIKTQGQKIEAIMSELLGNSNLSYKVMENNLIVIAPKEVLQQRKITGKITDATTGEALIGVNVVVDGTNLAVISDVNGEFNLTLPNASSTLNISYIGYNPEKIQVAGQSSIDIKLIADIKNLDEVVVIGYGTQKKATLTGAVSKVSGENIKESPTVNISNSLAGRITGVVANTRSGQPGDDGAVIYIRGISTTGDASPLYVIDGVAGRTGFQRLNPDDIESISVLKDASAAIYGSRAANGVILVTTKRGKAGKPLLEYSATYGVQQPTRFPKLMNSYKWATWMNEINERNGSADLYTANDLELFQNGKDPIGHPNTDWYKATVKTWSPQTEHSLSVSGGNEVVKYFLSGMYLYQDGNYKNSALNYNQYGIRSNVDVQISKNLKVGLNLNGRIEDRKLPGATSNDIWSNILVSFPVRNAYFPNGLPADASADGLNPVLMAEGKTGYNKDEGRFLNSDFTFDLKMPYFLEGLSLSGMGSFDYYNGFNKELNNQWDCYTYNSSTDVYTNERASTNGGYISLSETMSKSLKQTFLIKLDYQKKIGDNDINAFVAHENYRYDYNSLYGYRKALPSDAVDMLFAGSTTGMTNTDEATVFTRENYFGRFAYAYQNKYMAEFTLRYDGSSNFPSNKRWGTFPGGSIGWRISEESFIKDNFGFINQLKVKASWGLMGNDNVSAYQYLSRYTYLKSDGKNIGYYFGTDNALATALLISTYPNVNITWERANTKNFGFESSFWNGLLDVNFDYFYTSRSDILTSRNASVASYVGLNGKLPAENIGKINNKGFEIELNHRYKIGQVEYHIGGNLTYAKNKVVYMDEAANTPAWQKQEGKPYDAWVVYKAIGIFHTQAELDASPAYAGTKVGEIKYEDVNKDGKITSDDMVRLNYSNTPELTYGINLGSSYKGLTLDVLFQGQARVNQMIMPSGGTDCNYPDYVFEGRWTTDNPNANKVRAFDRKSTNETLSSTYWMKDASFIRLKNISLSYTIPKELCEKMKISGLKVFISGYNVFTIDKMKDYDPEMVKSFGDYYPQQRIFSTGINLSL